MVSLHRPYYTSACNAKQADLTAIREEIALPEKSCINSVNEMKTEAHNSGFVKMRDWFREPSEGKYCLVYCQNHFRLRYINCT